MGLCVKFRSRFVYSSHCNATVVDSLLAMSKQKTLKVCSTDFKVNLNGHTYPYNRSADPSMPVGDKVVTGKWSYPRSYAQVVKDNHTTDGDTTINQVKGFESGLKAKWCNSSRNRPTVVVNHDNVGSSSPESPCGQTMHNLVYPSTEVSSTIPVNVPYKKPSGKDMAKVVGAHNPESRGILSHQENPTIITTK